jgi:hypothetical protein
MHDQEQELFAQKALNPVHRNRMTLEFMTHCRDWAIARVKYVPYGLEKLAV